jgi:hypothetical protein
MPGVGFEPMTSVFERAKSVRALDRAATVIGVNSYLAVEIENEYHVFHSELNI